MAFLDFLFPKKCLGCGKKGRYFCQECVAKIEPVRRPICPICVKPSPFGQTHPGCRTKYRIDGLTSVFVYRGIIREGIKQLKYRFRFDLAEELVTLILNSIKVKPNLNCHPELGSGSFNGTIPKQVRNDDKDAKFPLDFKKTVVVPVPLHRWRQDWRGFNQAAVLAQILAEKLSLPFCEDLLIRARYTEPQTGLKKEDRKKNVEKAFEVNEKYISNKTNKTNMANKQSLISLRSNKQSLISLRSNKQSLISLRSNRHVVLMDDVWTTGATMKACGNLLKRARFEKVWGLTVAG